MSPARPILPFQIVSQIDLADMDDMMKVINDSPALEKYDQVLKVSTLKYLLGLVPDKPLKYTEELGEGINESVQDWFITIQSGEAQWMS